MARLIDADMIYRRLSFIMMQILEHSDEKMNEAMKGYNPSSFVEGFHHAEKRILKMLDSQPTVDAVEVVRCKDCKFHDPETGHCDHYMGTAIPLPRKVYDFCSYGEKMDGGEKE